MKKITFFNIKYIVFILLFFTFINSFSQTTIGGPYTFESNLEGWTTVSRSDRNNTAGRSYGGSFNLRVYRNGNAESPAIYSLSAYDKVDFKFFFAPRSMETGEKFYIEYRSTSLLNPAWTVVAEFVSGVVSNKSADFQNGNTIISYSKTVTLFKTDHTFPLLPTAQFRIRNSGNEDNDELHFDNITITGTTYGNSTTAPGGITSGLDLWLKANKVNGTGVATDGSAVTRWTDTNKGNHAEPVIGSQAPVYRNNTTRNINFNPVVDFENDNNTSSSDMTYLKSRHELKGTGGFNSNDVFVLIMPDPTITTSMVPLDTFTSTDPTGETYSEDVTGFGFGAFTGRFVNERLTYCIGTYNEDKGEGYGRADTNSGTDYNQIGIVNFRHNGANTNMELYFNAKNVGNKDNDPSKFAQIKNTRYWLGRSQYWDGSFDGRIAEVITYTSRKTDGNLTQERNRIQSYLAIKYGITLGANGTSQDYVNSDGNVIWDVNTGVPADDVFNYDIAGIGRDDASELYQKQSRSVNNALDAKGRTQGVLTMGITNLFATNNQNPNTLGNKQFLIWGNNGVNLNTAAVAVQVDMSKDIGAGLETWVEFNGIARTWKVVESGGNIPSVKVAMLKSAIRTALPPDGRYLMFISDTPNFDPTADYRVMNEELNELGEAVMTTNYDFNGVKYITFGWAPERVYERSILFNGTNNYVDMEDNLNLNTSGFTVSAWIKRDVNSIGSSIISKRATTYGGTTGYDFSILADGKFQAKWKNSSGNNQQLTSSVAIPLNIWHNIAVSYTGTQATIYIDGVADTSATLAPPAASTHSFLIGAGGKVTIDGFFHGNIDEVRVWKTNLSVDQLRFVMNQEIQQNTGFVRGSYFQNLGINPTKNDISTVPWSQLAAYYPMSTYTYTNTKDESGNGIQGALRQLRTVDKQTAPLPYISINNGNWSVKTTWTNGSMQTLPGVPSIINPTKKVDWNIVEIKNDITIESDDVLGYQISTLGLIQKSGDLQVNGNTALNTGNGLTVTHYLKLDGTIDLEGESQLIQTDGSDLDPTSSGRLERDQQGTKDLYTYNYWSSPVGVRNATTNNNSYRMIDHILKNGMNPANPKNITFLTSGYDGSVAGSDIKIADYWIWKYANKPNNSYSDWIPTRSTTTIHTGEGFTMKGVSNTNGDMTQTQNYVFDGKPNNGNFTLPILINNEYLIGNPYPSAMDANEFIKDNISNLETNGRNTNGNIINGALYFWEHFASKTHVLAEYQGGYGIYTLMGGTPAFTSDTRINVGGGLASLKGAPQRYIPVGQGFFVSAILDPALTAATNDPKLSSIVGGDIIFKNSQRIFVKESPSTSVFIKNSNTKGKQTTSAEANLDVRQKIRIMFDSPKGYHRQLLVGVDENASNNFDIGYDAPLNEDNNEDMFWILNSNNFIIQAVNNFDTEQTLPLGVKISKQGLATIKIDELENIASNKTIYLHDKQLNTYHNLKDSNYQVFLTPGKHLNRFEITFANATSLSTETMDNKSFQVYFSNDTRSFIIHNPDLKTIESADVLNVLGQSIFSFKVNKNENYIEYKPKHINTGAYIIKLKTDSGIISKKVLIE